MPVPKRNLFTESKWSLPAITSTTCAKRCAKECGKRLSRGSIPAAIAKRIFELYATGEYSLASLRKAIQAELGKKLQKGYLHKLLRNPFYGGFYMWDGRKYRGTHPLFIDPAVFQRTQEVLNNFNRPRQQKHEFAFSGLLTCAFDECAVTAEIKKGKYVYYHCTGYRGKCDLPYMR